VFSDVIRFIVYTLNSSLPCTAALIKILEFGDLFVPMFFWTY
jgi:hypothetical protein